MVSAPRLYDAVTLRHFAVAEELDLCRVLHEDLPTPCWTQAVADEIAEGAALGEDDCLAIQECAWLGEPFTQLDLRDVLEVQRLRIALSGVSKGPVSHAGEAETLYVTEKLGGSIVTDDGPAHDFASRRLGSKRVWDTIDILRDAVRRDERTPNQAAEIAAIVTASGRHLRRPHPRYPDPDYFQ